MSISYEEYNELIGKHKGVKRNRMRPGCYYYIEDTSRKEYQYRDVYHGKFLRINNQQELNNKKDKLVRVFEDVEYVVNPFDREGVPFGFAGREFKYILDNSRPCEEDVINKKNTMAELKTDLDELRIRPVEENETNITFIGEDYREANRQFQENRKREGTNGGKKRKHTKKHKIQRHARKSSTKKNRK